MRRCEENGLARGRNSSRIQWIPGIQSIAAA
jgi:hypothetical protein